MKTAQPAELLAFERVLAMALQHIRICAPNKEVEDAIESVSVESLAAHRGEVDGWVLVPREPTHEMCAATIGKKTGGWATQRMRNAFNTWIKMVAASPHPPQAQAGAGDAVPGVFWDRMLSAPMMGRELSAHDPARYEPLYRGQP